MRKSYNYYEKVEAGHHRVEKRQVWTVDVSELPPLHNQALWAGLKTVVMIVSKRRLWNKTTTEARFYLSSLSSNAEKIAGAIRSHWALKIAYIGHSMLHFPKMKAGFANKLSRKFCTSTSFSHKFTETRENF